MDDDPSKKPKLEFRLPPPDVEDDSLPTRLRISVEESLVQSQLSRDPPAIRLPEKTVTLPSASNLLPKPKITLDVAQSTTEIGQISPGQKGDDIVTLTETTGSSSNIPDSAKCSFELPSEPFKLYPMTAPVNAELPMTAPVNAELNIKLVPVNHGFPLEWSHFVSQVGEPSESEPEISVDVTHFPEDDEGDPEPAITDQKGKASTPNLELYLNSALTVKDSVVAILSFASATHLSGVDFCKLLDLLNLLLPKPNNLPPSKHSVFKIFENDKEAMNTHFYCNGCWERRLSLQDKCNKCEKSSVKYFITTSIVSQLQNMYARPGFADKLNYKLNRCKTNSDNIEDIYDSSVYKEAEQSLGLDAFNISLSWYTDGVSLYNCSSYSLWPFVFVINELPPHERYKEENLLIGGLWGDKSKPHPNVFLLPMYKEIVKLREGFYVKQFGQVEDTKVTAVVLFGSGDMPAKALFMNMKGHAGHDSCPKCLIYGEKSKRTGQVMVFPHEDELILRTEENYQECVKEAVLSKEVCKGVKGVSLLSYMSYSSLIKSVSIDSMHCLSLGIVKQLLRLWFDQTYSDQPFSLVHSVDKINYVLKTLNLPHYVERLPEDVTKPHFWKASLCRNYLLSIALPLMKLFMKRDYFLNFSDLVNGASILHQSSISMEEIALADNYLNRFSKNFQTLYGLRHMSANVHLLRHLAASVVECGNLCITSCFKLEGLNGQIVDLVHGTTHATKQVFTNLSVVTKLPLLVQDVESEQVKVFCQKLQHSNHLVFSEKIDEYIHVVGNLDAVTEQPETVSNLLEVFFQGPFQYRTFSRVFKHGILFVSSSYTRGSRLSSFCKYVCDVGETHGKILCFVKACVTPPQYFACICRSDNVNVEDLRRYFLFSSAHGTIDMVPISKIVSITWCLNVKGLNYLVDPLNKFEME